MCHLGRSPGKKGTRTLLSHLILRFRMETVSDIQKVKLLRRRMELGNTTRKSKGGLRFRRDRINC